MVSSQCLSPLTACHIYQPPVAQASVWTHGDAAHVNDVGDSSSLSICSARAAITNRVVHTSLYAVIYAVISNELSFSRQRCYMMENKI